MRTFLVIAVLLAVAHDWATVPSASRGVLDVHVGWRDATPGVATVKVLQVSLANNTNTAAWIDGRVIPGHHLLVSFLDHKGLEIGPCAQEKTRISSPLKGDFVKVAPGVTITRTILVDTSHPDARAVRLRVSHGSSDFYAQRFGIVLCEWKVPTVTAPIHR